MSSEVFLTGHVDLLAIGDVLEEHRHLADVREGGAGGGEAGFDVVQRLARLGGRVVTPHGAAVLVGGHAAGDEDDVPGPHHLGEVADRLRQLLGNPDSLESHAIKTIRTGPPLRLSVT